MFWRLVTKFAINNRKPRWFQLATMGTKGLTLIACFSTSRYETQVIFPIKEDKALKQALCIVETDKVQKFSYSTHTHATILRPSVWVYPGEPVPEETFIHWHLSCSSTILISFLHLPQTIASSLLNPCTWQSLSTTSNHVLNLLQQQKLKRLYCDRSSLLETTKQNVWKTPYPFSSKPLISAKKLISLLQLDNCLFDKSRLQRFLHKTMKTDIQLTQCQPAVV